MRKRLFMLSTLLLLVGLAVGTRYGDVVLYTADWVFAAATLVVFAAWCFWWLPDHRLVALSLDWSSLLLVVAVIVLTLLSPYGYGAQVEAAKLGSAFLLAVMVLNLVQERGDLQFFLNGILFLGMGMAAVSFAYYMAAMSPLFYFTPLWASNLQYHFVVNGQLWGLWQYHNSFAGFLVLCILLSVGMATGDKRRDWRLLYDACAGFLLMVLYLTTSRGAFLTGILGLIALVLLAPHGWRGRILLRVLIVGAAAAGFTVLNRVTWATAVLNADKGAALGTFVTGGADQSNDTRVHLIVLALRLFSEHVWAGTGLGTFPHVWTAFEWVPDVSRRIDPHSFFFRFLAETGLLGTVPLFTWIVRRGLHGLDRVFGSCEDMAVTGLWAGTLAYFLHMCMDVDYVYAVAPAVLFLCLALLSTRTVTYDLLSRDDRHTMVRHRRISCLIAGGLALLLALVPIQRGVASLYALRLGGLDPVTKAERLTDAVVRDPGNDMYWNLLGSTYASALAGGVTGPVTDAARSAFVQARTLTPEDYRPWWSQGMLELNLKSPTALTCLQQAERLYPTLAGIKGWLALAMVYVGDDVPGAEAKAAEALAITKGEPYAVTAQAFCALARGETARAKELLNGVARQGFTNTFAYYGLSLCYRAVGDTAMERSELVYSHRINPNLVEAMARLRILSPL
ncbi:O-antigen ligase domain-containing protein [Candidatus Cryosericum hinesii]|jgi:O-antigen ligase|uniref:O-antigen ligase domain-containing protein n=1 Tax=Candidatus Cryosericum hinesii TaxID=2290915 RepID=A0A398D9C0_9BACT|nr:O-antigen ligase family protein [Candidatus Cryosericum hinesii]RIE11655.1 O-antigen ligase domain-containing protein [Candidatus Cryosericum hinesii]RIE14423.1 O-antigen ligase domain-containing protein [Candidatus Cryosericum hinesii]